MGADTGKITETQVLCMAKQRKKLGDMLVAAGLLRRDQLREILDIRIGSDEKLGQFLIKRGMLSETRLVSLLSEQLNVERYDPQKHQPDAGLTGMMSAEFARQHRVVPLKQKGGLLTIAMTDPMDIRALDAVESITNAEIEPVICTAEEHQKLFGTVYAGYAGLKKEVGKTDDKSADQTADNYFKILQLKREPFSNSPDPFFFFPSSQYKKCLRKIDLSIRLRRGLSVIVGDVGTGKTTLCRHLIRRLSSNEGLETHLILDPYFSNPNEFLCSLAELVGLSDTRENRSDRELREEIKRYLFQQSMEKKKTLILIIDEGQVLPDFCLEILREFLNYESNEFKLLQIVVFAQMEFERKLERKPDLADRVNLYHKLEPLSFKETGAMIKFRLDKAADGRTGAPFFTYPALWAIYRATGGYPRKIITLCHRIMLGMIIRNRSRAGWFLVRSCVPGVFPSPAKRRRWAGTAALAALAAAVIWLGWNSERLYPPFRSSSDKAPQEIVSGRELTAVPPMQNQPAKAAFTEEKGHTDPSVGLPGKPPADGGQEKREAGMTADMAGQAPLRRPDSEAEPESAAKAVRLAAIRGARHTDYSRIVFDFAGEISFQEPVVENDKIVLRLESVKTALDEFRKYVTFNSSVRLLKRDGDIEARIGLPETFGGFDYFTLQKPYRIVINLY
jgi:general secretion pathway protein A